MERLSLSPDRTKLSCVLELSSGGRTVNFTEEFPVIYEERSTVIMRTVSAGLRRRHDGDDCAEENSKNPGLVPICPVTAFTRTWRSRWGRILPNRAATSD